MKKREKKRGETWIGIRPTVFKDRKREKNKRACRKWKKGNAF